MKERGPPDENNPVISIAKQTYWTPLGGHVRDEVGRELHATLVELIDLSSIGKQRIENVGLLFRPLHLQLDELIETWRDLAVAVHVRYPLSAIGLDLKRTCHELHHRSARPPSICGIRTAISAGGRPSIVRISAS